MTSVLRASVVASLLAFLPLASCADGPFAHASPFDPDTDLQLSIVGGLDTVRVANVDVVYQLVTVPVINGYTAAWSSTAPNVLESQGDGRFIVRAIPAPNFPVQIRAQFIPGTFAVRNVVVTVVP